MVGCALFQCCAESPIPLIYANLHYHTQAGYIHWEIPWIIHLEAV